MFVRQHAHRAHRQKIWRVQETSQKKAMIWSDERQAHVAKIEQIKHASDRVHEEKQKHASIDVRGQHPWIDLGIQMQDAGTEQMKQARERGGQDRLQD